MAKEVSHTHTQPADSLGMEDGEEKNNKNPPWGLFPFCPDTPPDCSCGCGWVSPSSPPTFSPCHKRTGEPKLSGNLYLFFPTASQIAETKKKTQFFSSDFFGFWVLIFFFSFYSSERDTVYTWLAAANISNCLGEFLLWLESQAISSAKYLEQSLERQKSFFFLFAFCLSFFFQSPL